MKKKHMSKNTKTVLILLVIGIIAFCMGRIVERKKWMKKYEKEQEETEEDGGIARDHAGDR